MSPEGQYEDIIADESEAASGVTRVKNVAERRPAEVATFTTGLIVVLAALGFDLDETVVLAAFAVVFTLPAIISYIVTLYRESLYGEPPQGE